MADSYVEPNTAQLAGNNLFELLLFRLGKMPHCPREEIYGINVFKVREILTLPPVNSIAGSGKHILGIVDVRGQVISVIDLASFVGCVPSDRPKLLLVTEFARTIQGFAVDAVEDIVRLDWTKILPAEVHTSSTVVTSFAKLDDAAATLAQVIDVEQVLREVMPHKHSDVDKTAIGAPITLKPGSRILAADDSAVARALIEQTMSGLGLPYTLAKTGQEAWDMLLHTKQRAQKNGTSVSDEIALVLTDLEMPEMDGFTLTKNIKCDPVLQKIPVIIHSSLSGSANEEHTKKVGADAFISKFVAAELAEIFRKTLLEKN